MPNCKSCGDYKDLPDSKYQCKKSIPEIEDVSCLLKEMLGVLQGIRRELEHQNDDPAEDWKKT